MSRFLRYLFFLGVIRPIILLVLGLNVRRRNLLPSQGPALIVANHNSHLDTMVLITLFPARVLRFVRPVAAMDFLRDALRVTPPWQLSSGSASPVGSELYRDAARPACRLGGSV